MTSTHQLELLKNALQHGTSSEFSYQARDCILYALSLGYTAADLPLVYELSSEFQVFPTFGVLVGFVQGARPQLGSFLPNFQRAKLLHGEHQLWLHRPLPPSARLTTTAQIVHIADKGKAAVVTLRLVSRDAADGEVICVNEFTNFIPGAGGFQHTVAHPDYQPSASEPGPERPPDAQQQQKTTTEQAALYRLNGDDNPLHIDPSVSRQAGFDKPILHGLCTFGIAAKHVLHHANSHGLTALKTFKARFANIVIPGDELCTDIWQLGQGRFAFRVRNLTRNTVAIANGHALVARSYDPHSRL